MKDIFSYIPSISSVTYACEINLRHASSYLYLLTYFSLQCHNVWTGKRVWEKVFNGHFGFGQYIIENGIIYCAAEGDGYYAINAKNGHQIWRGARPPGTSSRLTYLNGVIYYTNGGDGHLWAVDANNGKTLWELESPDDDFGFKREINVLPGKNGKKGLVLTSTWHGAIAYEAER